MSDPGAPSAPVGASTSASRARASAQPDQGSRGRGRGSPCAPSPAACRAPVPGSRGRRVKPPRASTRVVGVQHADAARVLLAQRPRRSARQVGVRPVGRSRAARSTDHACLTAAVEGAGPVGRASSCTSARAERHCAVRGRGSSDADGRLRPVHLANVLADCRAPLAQTRRPATRLLHSSAAQPRRAGRPSGRPQNSASRSARAIADSAHIQRSACRDSGLSLRCNRSARLHRAE